jgi:ERCC4-type nuclease
MRVILCDTREQRPPPLPDGFVYVRATLAEGDFTTPTLLDVARIERKNPQDFASSMTRDHTRVFREAERLRPYAFKCIVVETDLSHFIMRRHRGAAHPNAIVGSICSLFARYGCPVLFAHDALTAGHMIAGILRRLEDAQSGPEAAA